MLATFAMMLPHALCERWCHRQDHCDFSSPKGEASCRTCDFCSAQVAQATACEPYDKFDARSVGCERFCKPEFKAAHCPRCQCQGCIICTRASDAPLPAPPPAPPRASPEAPAARLGAEAPAEWEYYNDAKPVEVREVAPPPPAPPRPPSPPSQRPSPPALRAPPEAAAPFLPVLSDAEAPPVATIPSVTNVDLPPRSVLGSPPHTPTQLAPDGSEDEDVGWQLAGLFFLVMLGVLAGSGACDRGFETVKLSWDALRHQTEVSARAVSAVDDDDDEALQLTGQGERTRRPGDELLEVALQRRQKKGGGGRGLFRKS